MSKRVQEGELVSNRSAYHNYEVLETLEAGIMLQGTEIKSLRLGGGNLQDNYIVIQGGAPFLKLASIAPYKFGNIYNHEERRERKLLLHKHEIQRLKKETQIKGLTLIALSLYLKKGMVKVKIGICRGKKAHDKRAALKKKEHQKEMRIPL
jgi:SsrA-binding protein